MGKKIDIVILSGHGSGNHALFIFLNLSKDIWCNCYNTNRDRMQAFIETDTSKKKAVFLDHSSYEADGTLDVVMNNLSEQPVLYAVSRDSLPRLLSVGNTHLLWWARDVTGVHHWSKGQIFAKAGSSKGVLKSLLHHPAMLSVTALSPKISSRFEKVVVGNFADMQVPKFYQTFNMLSEILGIDGDKSFSIPENPVNNRINNYHPFLKRLIIRDSGRDFIYLPGPKSLIKYNGWRTHYVVYTIDYDAKKWNIGNIKDDIEFLWWPHNLNEVSYDESKAVFDSHFDEVEKYIADMNTSERNAQLIYNEMECSVKKVFDFCKDDISFKNELCSFIVNEIDAFNNLASDSSKYFEESLNFLEEIDSSPK